MRKTLCLTLWMLSLLFFAPRTLFAADPPPETQQAMDKGLAAANQQDWELAIKYFSEAHQKDWLYYPAYFNLGLAHQNAGHELPAICWFRAYLQQVPNDTSKAAIQKEIMNLEVAVESKIRKLLKQALELAQALPEEDGMPGRHVALGFLFEHYARCGLTSEAASEITPLFGQKWAQRSDYTESYARRLYALKLVDEGDTDKALEVVASDDNTEVLGKLAEKAVQNKQMAKAVEYVSQMTDPGKASHLPIVIMALAENGRVTEAKALLEKYSANKIDKFQLAAKLAKFFGEKGRTEEAKSFAAIARTFYEESHSGSEAFYQVARKKILMGSALMAAGEKDQARSIADSLDVSQLDAGFGMERLDLIELYAKLGDLNKAVSLVDQTVDPSTLLFRAYLENGQIANAEKYLDKLRADSARPAEFGASYAKLAWAKLRAGDRAGFERVLQAMPVQNSWDAPDSTYNVDHFYGELSVLADQAGEKAFFDEFYAKVRENPSDGYRILLTVEVLKRLAYSRYDAGLLDDAEAILLREKDDRIRTSLAIALFNDWTGLDLLKALLLRGENVDAAVLIDKYYGAMDIIPYIQKIKDIYTAAGQPQKAAAAQKRIAAILKRNAGSDWVNWAKYFGRQTNTYDPEAAFNRIRSSQIEAGKLGQNWMIPGNVASIAGEYAAGLRSIARLESELQKTS